ncbi:MAG: nucleotidyltransferase domain-containing protein [Acidobacteriota bacterium]|nr:nucleotidyltransferase domain-containing protein [Acidobacteriota bacterium]
MQSPNFHLLIPVGTQVVTRARVTVSSGNQLCPAGAVGVVVEAPVDPFHSYRVRFTNGVEAMLRRDELTIRKRHQAEAVGLGADVDADVDLYRHVIYRCVVGSRAYGLDEEASDTDRRGIYLPPAELHWSLGGVPEQLENKEGEECYWELQKFLILALKANPNVLECLYTPLVETATPLAEELLTMRGIFISRLVYQTYNGYVMSQFKKLEQDIRSQGAIKWKHAMHLIRLLLSGVTILKEGYVPVRIEEHGERLLAIRHGRVSWDEVNAWRLALHQEFDEALTQTPLPERPDYERANAFLIKARRAMVSGISDDRLQ